MMKSKIYKFVFWSSNTTQGQMLLILLQVLSGGSGVTYSVFPTYQTQSMVVFFCSIFLVILWALIILVFNRNHGFIVLVLNRETGVLYDKKTTFRNVSLRRETIQELIAAVLDGGGDREKALREYSYKMGSGFAKQYVESILSGKSLIDEIETLKDVLQYDSSSGMGKFQVSKFADAPSNFIEVSVENPFSECGVFYLGYLQGIIEYIFGSEFDMKFTAGLGAAKVLNIHAIEKQ